MRRGVPVRRLATWLLITLSLGGAVGFVAMRLLVPSDGARVAFYEDAWAADGVRIAPIDSPAGALEPGDRIVRIADRPLEDWARSVLDPSVERPSGGAIPYVAQRSGARHERSVAWTPRSLEATLLDGWGVVVFSALFAATAAFVFVRRPDVPAATALVIVAAALCGSSVPWLIGLWTSDLVLGWPFLYHTFLTGVLYMAAWPGAIHLALVFPTPAGVVVRHPCVIPAVYVAAFGIYAVEITISYVASPSRLEWIGTWPLAQLAIIVPSIIGWLLIAVTRYVRDTDPDARARMRWASTGAVVSAISGLVLFMGPELLLGNALVPTSWIGLSALPMALGLAMGILRDRLFDIEVVVNRALVYGGLTLGVLAVYVVSIPAMRLMAGHDPGFAGSLLATGGAALVALPLRDLLQRWVNRFMYGDRDEPWRAMSRLAQRLEWAAEPDRAFPAIVDTVAEALRSPFVALEVVDAGEDGAPAIVAQHGSPSSDATVVQLLYGAEPVGRLLIGARAGERGFRQDEHRLLEDLGRQAGAAVRALRLREDLLRSREALVVAREEERRRLRRDLHDGLGPALAAIGLHAEAAATVVHADPERAQRGLTELRDEVGAVLVEIRRLVDGLRPPALDELGLVEAIRQQADRLEGSANGDGGSPRIAIAGEPGALDGLPAAVEVAAYRIAVEALTNAVRHARAETCRVRIEADEALRIEVVDDGRGIPPDARPGIGLDSMRARAAELGGELIVERATPHGTRVLARLPLAPATT